MEAFGDTGRFQESVEYNTCQSVKTRYGTVASGSRPLPKIKAVASGGFAPQYGEVAGFCSFPLLPLDCEPKASTDFEA